MTEIPIGLTEDGCIKTINPSQTLRIISRFGTVTRKGPESSLRIFTRLKIIIHT